MTCPSEILTQPAGCNACILKAYVQGGDADIAADRNFSNSYVERLRMPVPGLTSGIRSLASAQLREDKRLIRDFINAVPACPGELDHEIQNDLTNEQKAFIGNTGIRGWLDRIAVKLGTRQQDYTPAVPITCQNQFAELLVQNNLTESPSVGQ